MGLCAGKPNAQNPGRASAHAGMFQQFMQNQVVQQVGARRNWLLVFCLLACLMLNVFACILTQSEKPSASCETVGLFMHGSSVVVLLMGLVFYFIAMLNLAGSPNMFTLVSNLLGQTVVRNICALTNSLMIAGGMLSSDS